jgi:hypothetical protein
MQTTMASAVAFAALSLGLVLGVSTPWLGRDPGGSLVACEAGSAALSRLELLFGSERKARPPVSDADWSAFLDAEITPRFPDGLTVLSGDGQWRDPRGHIVKEATRVLVVWYRPAASTSADIEAIRAAYKSQFGQASVMRVEDRTSCVAF